MASTTGAELEAEVPEAGPTQAGGPEAARLERERRKWGAAVRPRSWVPSILEGVSRISFGTVKVDLSRKYGRYGRRGGGNNNPFHGGGDDDDGYDSRPMNHARIKIYRRMAFDPYVFNRKPQVDFAAGLSVGTGGDGQVLTPKCRLKVGPHIRLKLFPEPAFQYKQLVRPSLQSKFVLETKCTLPFQCFRELSQGEVPRQAYLGIRLRNDISTGLHLTSHGIEFDERVDVFGPYGTLRAAVQVDFPTEFPVTRKSGPPLKLRVNRLCMTIPTP